MPVFDDTIAPLCTFVYRSDLDAYVVTWPDASLPIMIPSPLSEVPPEVHVEFDALYRLVDAWASAHAEQVLVLDGPPEPSMEEQEVMEQKRIRNEAEQLVQKSMRTSILQAATFTQAEYSLLARAKLFDSWQAGVEYKAGYRLEHNGIVYEVMQDVTAQEHQPPSAEGMLAVYRPLSVDPESGEASDGSLERPHDFIYGMDVLEGQYYRYNGIIYLAKADMPACVWYPGTDGLWQWEEVMG